MANGINDQQTSHNTVVEKVLCRCAGPVGDNRRSDDQDAWWPAPLKAADANRRVQQSRQTRYGERRHCHRGETPLHVADKTSTVRRLIRRYDVNWLHRVWGLCDHLPADAAASLSTGPAAAADLLPSAAAAAVTAKQQQCSVHLRSCHYSSHRLHPR